MPRKRIIIDASSAILLVKTGLFRCLTDAYQVVMAEAVYGEVCRDGYPGARRFSDARVGGKILVLSARPETALPGEEILTGSGERETIRLFSQGEGDFVIIDDRKGAGFCRNTGIPYINALLFPRILMLAGAMSESEFRKRTSQLLALGRYSKEIVAVAEGASRERLGRFLPS
jgi:hypothetical protein